MKSSTGIAGAIVACLVAALGVWLNSSAVFCCRCEFALSARGSFSGVLDQMRFFRPCGAYTDLGHVSPAINRWAIFLRPRGTRLRTLPTANTEM